MAKYNYTTASDVPVKLTMTVYEMRALCDILRGEVARKGSERWLAKDLHATLVEALTAAGNALKCEGDWLTRSMIQNLRDGINDAQAEADKVDA